MYVESTSFSLNFNGLFLVVTVLNSKFYVDTFCNGYEVNSYNNLTIDEFKNKFYYKSDGTCCDNCGSPLIGDGNGLGFVVASCDCEEVSW